MCIYLWQQLAEEYSNNCWEASRSTTPLQRHHNECSGISDQQSLDCLHNRLFWQRSKKKSKLRVTGLCEGNSQGTGEFPARKASNAENVYDVIMLGFHLMQRVISITANKAWCILVFNCNSILTIPGMLWYGFNPLKPGWMSIITLCTWDGICNEYW